MARSHDELTISKNTVIRLAPKHRQPNVQGWLLASDGESQGLIPANYIKVYFFVTKFSKGSGFSIAFSSFIRIVCDTTIATIFC